jgi:hypothetical protein
MKNLVNILSELKKLGCCSIKISFEDEGALYNEVISMRKITAEVGLELSVKIGGCESKRDIIDCIDLDCDTVVVPMIESEFALKKFLKSLDTCKYTKKKGINLETIQGYENLDRLSKHFHKIDFVTFGRVDFVGSLEKDRSFVDTEDIYRIIKDVFSNARNNNAMCYLGGAVSINSKDLIVKLISEKLLDKFETRYVIYDVNKIDINNFEKLLYLANVFEVEWMKYISSRYSFYANKDIVRIKMIEERITVNSTN